MTYFLIGLLIGLFLGMIVTVGTMRDGQKTRITHHTISKHGLPIRQHPTIHKESSMNFPQFPSLLVSAFVFGVVAFLEYLSGHLSTLGIPALYAPLAALALATVINMVKQATAPTIPISPDSVQASPRGMDGQPSVKPASYLQRVLVG